MAKSAPEEAVQAIQFWPWPFSFEHGDLLSEGEDFKSSVASTSKEDPEYSKHGEDELGHEITLLTWRNVASSRQSLEILNRMLKNGLGRNSAFFLFLLSEAEVQFVEGPT